MFTIHRKDYDKFEGQYKGSTGWLNLDHEFFLRRLSTLGLDFYKYLLEKNIEYQDIKGYKTFVVMLGNSKL